jgi:4-azaleucine resistance transporter AzlC
MTQRSITFTHVGIRHGFRKCIPLGFSVGSYGLVYGLLAAKAGLSVTQALFMCFTVFAGASQLIAIDLWHHPLPVATILITTFIVNARHLLMGAALQPTAKFLTPLQAYGSLFFCADENWALTIKAIKDGERDLGFFLGSGLCIYVFWAAAAWIGYRGGVVIADPATYGLDFTFTAVFIALAVSLWQGKQDALPWGVAAVAATAGHMLLPGKWYILIGAVLGSAVEVWRNGRR